LARVPVSFLTELINLLNLSRAILWCVRQGGHKRLPHF
jgi:hypothetical protein